ncbi:aladin-like isoform X1 [Diabrotica undecimpunctata]|uniref:aladin-like isoform X1 n=2 Tax=Diabrotica undecimpunctata TaxID=50387 RepID=UPI003B63705A
MMRNLHDFELPLDGEVTLCQINGRVFSRNYDITNLNGFTTTLENYPKVHLTRDLLHPTTSGDEGKALFLPVNISFLKQLSQVYYEQGYMEALQTAASYNHVFISKSAKGLLDILKYIKKVRVILNPNLRHSGSSLIANYSQTRNWLNTTVRCIAWHPYCKKVAVVMCDDSVRIFNGDPNAISSILRCKMQKHITCVAWRPMSNTEIAVGYENGIIVWHIDPNSMISRPSISNAIILQRADHRPVMSIAWSPKGDKLVSVAACDQSILVWDVELDKTSTLKRSGGSGNLLVKWSPTGEKLFTCSNSLVFRVWDCRNWECERWTVLSGRVQSACWSNCGTTLLFATNTETIIYGVIVKHDLIFTSDADTSSNQALPMFDTTKVDIDGVIVGGLIQSMESDPTGKYLAVSFQDTDSVAIFSIIRQHGLQLVANSLVNGLAEEKPSTMSFLVGYEPGACLTIGWSSGRIQYFPIIYSDLSSADNTQVSTRFNSFNGSIVC